MGSSTRAVFAGGDTAVSADTNIIQYVTIQTKGDAIQFGDLGIRTSLMAGCSSQTRGLFGGGNGPTNSYQNNIPILIISKSGGARMMEGAISLMQMAKTSAKLTQLSKNKLKQFHKRPMKEILCSYCSCYILFFIL